MIRPYALAATVAVGFVCALSCGGGTTKNLPPPEYETAPLPDWEPEKPGPSAFDQALLEGEPVSDPPDSASSEGAEPGAGEAAGEAESQQNAATGAAGAAGWTEP